MQTQKSQFGVELTVDAMSGPEAISAMLASHIAALTAASGAAWQIAQAAELLAKALRSGSTVHYAAAGSSGLMAMADACELPGTFRVPENQIRICMAGGIPVDARMPGDTEDGQGEAVAAAAEVASGDIAIVVSASGTTPYALAFAEAASARCAKVVGLANVAGSALLDLADVPIAVATAPEVVGGSTRLGAGTAQKAVMNMISTQAGVLLGHVHDGMMVNLNPDNIKLRRRACDIVSRIADVTAPDAERALEATGYDVKLASLVAAGLEVETAQSLLNQNDGHLRPCLQKIAEGQHTNN